MKVHLSLTATGESKAVAKVMRKVADDLDQMDETMLMRAAVLEDGDGTELGDVLITPVENGHDPSSS